MPGAFDLSLFDFNLPQELIAQHPKKNRDESRLLVYKRETDKITHYVFRDIINFFEPGDCLVINNTKVFPARFLTKKETGGRVEVFLLNYPENFTDNSSKALALVKAAKKIKNGLKLPLSDELYFEIIDKDEKGYFTIIIHHQLPLDIVLARYGKMPLPPYIARDANDSDIHCYQTKFAKTTGSVAAPTAGLHFTENLLDKLKERGVNIAEITLHVGIGTFLPVRTQDIREHKIHPEWVEATEKTCKIINETKKNNKKVFATGTTSTRTLEFIGDTKGIVKPYSGLCDLYIYPGYKFKVVDSLITNFHLPMSSLIILASAFAGRENILKIYKEAIEKGYRFYSYGDAMLIE